MKKKTGGTSVKIKTYCEFVTERGIEKRSKVAMMFAYTWSPENLWENALGDLLSI